MNDGANDPALRALADEQRHLRELLARLDTRVAALEQQPAATAAPPAVRPAPPVAVAPVVVAPAVALVPAPPRAAPVPPPLPAFDAAPPPLPPPAPAFVPEPPGPAAAPATTSLEERIGGTWLVRIGVVALLTGLALGVGWLVQNVAPRLGVAGKVAGLYLVAGALTGAGFWLERRAASANPGLRNYARVLLGGGLAAVYFVTYAAGFLPGLRVIPNEFLAGALLLAWAAFMAWTADRRDSQTLATFSLLLAYFTTAIHPAAAFALGSNALLTAAAIVLAGRHRWPVFSFAALLATYGAYTFWRLTGDVQSARDPAHFWPETGFLGIYWALFTAAAFVVPTASLPPRRRAAFLASNHGALFGLVAVWVQGVYPGSFWRWALGFGLTLIALGETRRFGLEAAAAGVSRVLGIIFATLGMAAYFGHGWSLALALAAESVVLLLAAEPPGLTDQVPRDWVNRVQLGLAGVAAFGAFVAAGLELDTSWRDRGSREIEDWGRIASGLAVAGTGLFNAAWSRHRGRAGSAVFAGLGLAVALMLLNRVSRPELFAPLLAAAVVGVTVGLAPALRVPAVAGYGLGYLLIATVRFLERHPWTSAMPPGWETAAVAGAAVALCHWWQRSLAFPWRQEIRWLAQGATALGAVVVLDAALRPAVAPGTWMALGAGLAVLAAGYGLATRSLALGAAGQAFLLSAAGILLERAANPGRVPGGERGFALAPAGAAFLVVAATKRFTPAGWMEARPAARGLATVYEWLGAALFAAWAVRFGPADGRFALLAAAGAGAIAAGLRFGERRWEWQGGALAVVGALVFLTQSFAGIAPRLSWWNVPGLLALAAAGQFARRSLPAAAGLVPRGLPAALTFVAALGGWRWLTDNLSARVGGDWTLAAGWSAYAAALFGAGLALRERRLRWVGLGILGVTMGRIFLVDFWNADTGHRILSLLAFSLVLLGLGFVYNRFGAKLREWM